MATTKIWPIKDTIKRVLDYAGNPEKTEWNDLAQTLHYAEDGQKTEWFQDEKVHHPTLYGEGAKQNTASP